ncbi:hypothetical protein GQX46_10315 [Staphylococcus aureus]|nr:hypothetical protein [Staphylococcus aureus]
MKRQPPESKPVYSSAASDVYKKQTNQSLPAILDQKQGYKSDVMHGDYKTFWNRDQVYKHLVSINSMMQHTMTCCLL